MLRTHHNSSNLRRRGQGLVEFALIVPVLIAMLLGVMEFGWLVKNTLTVSNATREGARAAAMGKTNDEIATRIQSSMEPLSLTAPGSSVDLRYSATDGSDGFPTPVTSLSGKNTVPVGNFIKVTVKIKHRPLSGFFKFLSNRSLTAYVTMRREAS